MNKKLRIHLGIIINNYHQEHRYSGCHTLGCIKNYYPDSYQKINIIYDCYSNLIRRNPCYNYLPIFTQELENTLFIFGRNWKWNLTTHFYYSEHHQIELIIKNNKTKRILKSCLKKESSIIRYSNSYRLLEELIINTDNVNWGEMIRRIHQSCPLCGHPFSFKDLDIDFFSVVKDNSRFLFNGKLVCKLCTVLDCPQNKSLMRELSPELDQLIVELWIINQKLGIKYFPQGMIDILERSNYSHYFPKFMVFILKKESSYRLDWIILLKLLRKKLSTYLNNLFKIIFEYV